MKLTFLGDVIFEGDEASTKQKYEEIKKTFKIKLEKLFEELPKVYPKRKIDTDETFFENLRILSPEVYEELSYFKDFFGDKFLGFDFRAMNLASVCIITTIPHGNWNGHKTFSLFSLYSMVTKDIKNEFKLEE